MAEARIHATEPSATERTQGARPHQPRRALPLLRLLLYYALITALGAAIMNLVPGGRQLIAAPISPAAQEATQLATGRGSAPPPPPAPQLAPGEPGRLALSFITVLGALAIALPVAWVHMLTRRLRYNPSLVHTMVILPIVVSGVVLVVKNSLALAFALAGIVAGVRFRQKLNEPKEAVYILLALGIGLAAGVQALDIALAVSFAFNAVVLVIWRWDLGSLDGRSGSPLLAFGNPRLLPMGDARREVYRHALAAGRQMATDGILVVYSRDPEAARHGIEATLVGMAEDWRFSRSVANGGRPARFEVLIQLAGKADPVDLLGELEERWSARIDAAEYIPFRRRHSDEDDDDED